MTRFLKGTDRPARRGLSACAAGPRRRGVSRQESGRIAADSIRAAEAAGMTIEYTTNNSSRFQHVVADQLKGFGLDVEPWQVITSSVVAAVWWPRRCPPARAYRYWAPSICAMRSPATA